jgi:hypothetical protein
MSNVGLLVKVWGKVTSTGDGYYYIDDGSNVNDGSGSIGVRLEGVISYVPDVGDYVAVNGISGLETISGNLARVVRVAASSDFTPFTPLRPDGVTAYATGSDRITVYWPATPGATSYCVYAGTATGQESSTPISATVQQSGSYYYLTHENLTEYQDYYYVVRAISGNGTSAPSDEVSAVPYGGAIPWDSTDAYAITDLVQNWYGTADYVKVIGPDGRIFETGQTTASGPEGSVTEGTNLFTFSSSEVIPLSDGYWPVDTLDNGETESLLVNGPVTNHYTLNTTDGPYRRVSSKYDVGYTFCGAEGWFYAPDRNGMSVIGNMTTPYIYLGSHIGPTFLGPKKVDIDAGLMWNKGRHTWDSYMFTKVGGAKNPNLGRVLLGRANTRFVEGSWVDMAFWIDYDVSVLMNQGMDYWLTDKIVLMVSAYPAMSPTAEIKRAHSIAYGVPGKYRNGSYIWGEECNSVNLLQWTPTSITAVPWTVDRTANHGSGCWPRYSFGIVNWDETSPYAVETNIDIGP